jgi:hypothetical protein
MLVAAVVLVPFLCVQAQGANLIGHWKFDETSTAGGAADSAGSADGTYVAGVTLGEPGATAATGTSMRISGRHSMRVTDVPINDSFTALVWVKSAQSVWNRHGWSMCSREANGFIIHPNQSQRATGYYVMNNTGNYRHIGTVTPDDITEWHQYGLMYDADTSTAYNLYDGAIVSSFVVNNPPVRDLVRTGPVRPGPPRRRLDR